jgi:hypothetical protein
MPWVGFEHTIPASKRTRTVHALDRSATVTGQDYTYITWNGGWRNIKDIEGRNPALIDVLIPEIARMDCENYENFEVRI